MHLALIGMSHHTAPIEVRERLSCSEPMLPRALQAVVACPGALEAVILSTCNRLELYVVADGPDVASVQSLVRRHLAAFHQIPEALFTPHLYCRSDVEAVNHLMRVAAGLDSLVLGEAQILGQVRNALMAAQEARTAGSNLVGLFKQAIVCGRRVQTETALGRGAFSIGHAAVDLARSIFADLSHARVLLLGAGKMSELTMRHLVDNGVRFVVVANRTYDRAEAMAAQFGGTAVHYDRFPDELVTADIVIASTSAPHPILKRDILAPVVRKRRGKPLFLIDIAVPRDIDPDVSRLDNVFLKNIDDLQEVVQAEAGERAAEAALATNVAAEEADKFLAWYRTREVAPVLDGIRSRLENIRQGDLAILRAKLAGISERDWQAIEISTRAMMSHVARTPILRLKREAGDGVTGVQSYDLASAAREIFGLADPEGEPTSDGKAPDAASAPADASSDARPTVTTVASNERQEIAQ